MKRRLLLKGLAMAVTTFIPIVSTGPIPAYGGSSDSETAYIFDHLVDHPLQQRELLYRHPTLDLVAHQRCVDMARRGYEGHVDPEGREANWHVCQAGYKLVYKCEGNNIESLAWGGNGEPIGAWEAWMGSEAHRTHLLGLVDTFRKQTMVGVGHYHLPESRMRHYWCVLSCPPEL